VVNKTDELTIAALFFGDPGNARRTDHRRHPALPRRVAKGLGADSAGRDEKEEPEPLGKWPGSIDMATPAQCHREAVARLLPAGFCFCLIILVFQALGKLGN
jgi:hypothetical protein